MAKKKDKTVEEIIADYQGLAGKPFKERIKKFEELHDSDLGHQQRIVQHAQYIIMGKPSDLENYPGAYNEAYKVLDKTVENDTDKLELSNFSLRKNFLINLGLWSIAFFPGIYKKKMRKN